MSKQDKRHEEFEKEFAGKTPDAKLLITMKLFKNHEKHDEHTHMQCTADIAGNRTDLVLLFSKLFKQSPELEEVATLAIGFNKFGNI